MKAILSEIIRRVRDEQDSIAETVTAGVNINTFDDYQRMIGRYDGLKLTLDIINEILTEDDEEN